MILIKFKVPFLELLEVPFSERYIYYIYILLFY
nr:MAG TPA: hypothetical protein [Caudoviricetes sp.]